MRRVIKLDLVWLMMENKEKRVKRSFVAFLVPSGKPVSISSKLTIMRSDLAITLTSHHECE